MRSTKGPELARYFDRCARRFLAVSHAPGVAVGVVRKGRVIYARGFGYADVRAGIPVTPATIFSIGSCTKAFTATLAAMLVEEKILEWDRPVREYMSFFRLRDPVASRLATLRDLLVHRCGLAAHEFACFTSGDTRVGLIKRLRHLEPGGSFRAGFQYSNLSYVVVGALIEHVTGKTWESFLRERILQPLGMKAAGFVGESGPNCGNAAVGYAVKRGKIVPWLSTWPKHTDLVTAMGRPYGPSGSVVSNVEDTCRWLVFQMKRGMAGTHCLIAERCLRELHMPQIVLPPFLSGKEFLDPSCAMGWIVQPYHGHRWIHHWGGGDGNTAMVSFVPDLSLGVAVLSNFMAPLSAMTALSLNIYDRLMGMRPVPWHSRWGLKKTARPPEPPKGSVGLKRQPGTKPSRPLDRYAGDYGNPGYGRVTVKLQGSRLVVRFNSLTFTAKHWHGDIFELRTSTVLPWWTTRRLSFNVLKGRKIASLAISFDSDTQNIVFTRL